MRFRILIFIFAPALFLSCVSLRSPVGKREFFALVKTCKIDSTEVLEAKTITLVEDSYLNASCENVPKGYSAEDWPIKIFFDFKTRDYWYMFNPTPRYINDKLESVALSTHDGLLSVNRKKRLITLSIVNLKWQKTFYYTYNKEKKTLILSEKKT